MKEDLITFETAKLAKEKGFGWKVIQHYRDGNSYNKELIRGGSLYNMNDSEEQSMWNINLYSAPSQSLLQKWLREKHNMHVSSDCTPSGWFWHIEETKGKGLKYQEDDDFFTTYEEALEKGLQEGLKLIKS